MYYFQEVDEAGGLLKEKKKLLKEAAEDSKDKTTKQASVIGWNKAAEYCWINAKYHDSMMLHSKRNPPVCY